MRHIALLTLVLSTLAGCASMNAEECETADWRTIGYEDGAKGHEASAIARHRKACAEHGVTPDFDAYETGRTEGLGEFCRPANGYQIGRKGASYNGVCPPELEAAFLAAYEDGHTRFGLEKDVDDTQGDIRRVDRDLKKAREDARDLEARLIADGIDSAQRSHLLGETKEVARHINDLERKRDELIYELGVREERLSQYLRSRPD